MIHDIEAVVAWKHWKHLHFLGAERRAAAEAMGLRLRASRQAEMRRRDEEAMRAERKKNLAEQRKKRREEDWRGLRQSSTSSFIRSTTIEKRRASPRNTIQVVVVHKRSVGH